MAGAEVSDWLAGGVIAIGYEYVVVGYDGG